MNHIDYINEVVGLDYIEGSASVDNGGLDCWGLVIDSFKRIDGIDLPELSAYADLDLKNGISEALNKGRWEQLDAPQLGCVVACFKSDTLVHVGRYFCGQMLHAVGKRERTFGNVCLWKMQNVERMFDKLEFYKWR